MNAAGWLRRVAIFAGVSGGGMAVVAWAAGGLRPHGAGEAPPVGPPPARPDIRPEDVVTIEGGGATASLGPGRGGRLDRDDVAVVRGRAVRWRELTAEWTASSPLASREAGVILQRLEGARLTFFPRPTDERPEPAARDTEPGVTSVSGRSALLRRRENGPVSAHLEGDCVATHRVSDADAMVLRSDALELRSEERGGTTHHLVETDRPVRIESGGSVVTGTGLVAELDSGRRSGATRIARLRRDVNATLRSRPGRDGTGRDVRVACTGSAEIQALDRPGRDGRQPWRATFHEDVVVEDAASKMTAGDVVVEFVRTGTTDRAAGAESAELRSLTATGGVRIDGTGEASVAHVECESLRRFAEDARTDVTILEGNPVVRWEGRSQASAGAAPPSRFEVKCSGPARMRVRRDSAAQDSAAEVTLVFEGDVVATERRADTGDLRSEIRAPRVTVEARRAGDGRLDPRLVRAEQGAEARWVDFAAKARTITAVAAQPGGMQRVALVGEPVATYRVREGANPFGGTEPPGLLVLSSPGRIDVDVAPEPPSGTRPEGTRAALRTSGGLLVRKTAGEDETWRLSAKDGDAKVGWDGAVEELHATGDARLAGRGPDGRTGDLTGERITVRRSPGAGAPQGPDAWKAIEAAVDGAPGRPAVAALADPHDGARRDEVRAREIAYTAGGTALVARGDATALLHRAEGGSGTLEISAAAMRADLDPQSEGRARIRRLTAEGGVSVRDAMHRLVGDRATYDPLRGDAEVTGAPAKLFRREDPKFESSARGPVIRARFDPATSDRDRFRGASLPAGGEIVAYFAVPARQRVTTTTTGTMEVTRTEATCTGQVVTLYESRLPGTAGTPDRWNADARIDCTRLHMTFDPAVEGGKMSEKIRTLTATGTPDAPARVRTRNASGDREAWAEAERIEGSQRDTKLRLTCPSNRTRIHFHDVTSGRRVRADSATFDYVTFEWTDLGRAMEVE